MPVFTQSETTYSITLTGLTQNDLVRIIKDRRAQDLTLKEIKQEVTRILNMNPLTHSQTKAVKMIEAGGKAECPVCRRGFEPRGLYVHLERMHKIQQPQKWLQAQDGNIKLLPAPQLGAGAYRCPVCGETGGVKSHRPFMSQDSVNKHISKLHPAQWAEMQKPQAEAVVG